MYEISPFTAHSNPDNLRPVSNTFLNKAGVAELVDASDSKSDSYGVWVRFPPPVFFMFLLR